MQIQGKLHLKYDAKQITDRFRKREFVVEYAENPQYPQFLLMQVTNDKCELLDDYNEGDQLDLHFDLRGREWTSPKGETKFFNSLEVWRVGRVQANDQPPPPSDADAPSFADEDLPF